MELYPCVGDKDELDKIRARYPFKGHCPWLRRDPNACNALPEGIDGAEPGAVCPHNTYVHNSQVFERRDGIMDTVERIFRSVNAAEAGIVSESILDPLSVTELLTARAELNRQENERMKREHEKARLEAQANRNS